MAKYRLIRNTLYKPGHWMLISPRGRVDLSFQSSSDWDFIINQARCYIYLAPELRINKEGEIKTWAANKR